MQFLRRGRAHDPRLGGAHVTLRLTAAPARTVTLVTDILPDMGGECAWSHVSPTTRSWGCRRRDVHSRVFPFPKRSSSRSDSGAGLLGHGWASQRCPIGLLRSLRAACAPRASTSSAQVHAASSPHVALRSPRSFVL